MLCVLFWERKLLMWAEIVYGRCGQRAVVAVLSAYTECQAKWNDTEFHSYVRFLSISIFLFITSQSIERNNLSREWISWNVDAWILVCVSTSIYYFSLFFSATENLLDSRFYCIYCAQFLRTVYDGFTWYPSFGVLSNRWIFCSTFFPSQFFRRLGKTEQSRLI